MICVIRCLLEGDDESLGFNFVRKIVPFKRELEFFSNKLNEIRKFKF